MNEQAIGQKKGFVSRFLGQWDLQMLVIPSIIFILVFMYIPMYGLIMAFQDYRLGDFPGFSEWVGTRQFDYLFHDPNFFRVLRNTLVISFLKLAVCFPMPIVFAIMLNEIKVSWFKRSVQTISYLPHFISWVVAAVLLFDFLSSEASGAVNSALLSLGVIDSPIAFFGKAEYYWTIATVTELWKEMGWNTIIFIAAITGIDTEMYEAADMDGATRLQKIWYITTGSIRPIIILLFILTVGGIMNANFDQSMMLTKNMTNGLIRDTADVIDTYVYRIGITQARYSYSAAAGLFKSVINFLLLLGANKLADKLGENALF